MLGIFHYFPRICLISDSVVEQILCPHFNLSERRMQATLSHVVDARKSSTIHNFLSDLQMLTIMSIFLFILSERTLTTQVPLK